VAVNDVSLEIDQGEIVGIVGESGCGKSMTAFSILGIVPHPGRVEAGSIRFKGHDLLAMTETEIRRVRGRQISLVYQDPLSSLNPSFSILWHFEELFAAHGVRQSSRNRLRVVIEALKRVRIPDPEQKIHQYPHQLSGGMRQRVVIAMALALQPAIIIADEPTTALDVTTQKEIFNLIERLRQELSISYIVISHDLFLLGERCDRIYVMYAGQIVEAGPSTSVFREPLHPYSSGLVRSIPRLDTNAPELHTIRGEVQNLMDLPSGCFFSNRCPMAEDRCGGPQELREVRPGRSVRCWKVAAA